MTKLTTAIAGEELTIKEPRQVVVQVKCDINVGHWFCITHELHLDNEMAKAGHIGVGAAHHMVWVCADHGFEQP